MRKLLLSLVLPFLLSNFVKGQTGFIHYNYAQHQFKVKNAPTPLAAPKATKPPVWGNYFWEFGDGHYSFDSVAVHPFPKQDIYDVRVFLTPNYSYSQPVSYQRSFAVNQPNGPLPTYSLGNNKVSIESTGRKYLVPGHEMQMVLHYKAPSNRSLEEGYLLLFYNNRKEKGNFKINFDPFQFEEERLYYGEESLGDSFFSLPQGSLPAEGLAVAKKLLNQHNSLRLFKIGAMEAGQERRLFCTITSDERLSSHQDKNRELSITALWLHAGDSYDPAKCQYVHKMEILEVHDPNRIKVQKKHAYYLPKRATELNYKIDFQNKAKGVVEDVIIRVLIPQELDSRTIQIPEKKLDPMVPQCPEGDPEGTTSCYNYKIKTSAGKDSLVFSFRNIALEGTRSTSFFQNRKNTKGQFNFSIENRTLRKALTELRADIIFKGSREVISTQFTTTKWRQRSINLSIGRNFRQWAGHHVNTAHQFEDWYNIEVSALDAPMGQGAVFGFGIAGTAFQFLNTDIRNANPSLLLPSGGIMHRTEKIKMEYLESRALVGYQVNRFLRFFGGGGITVPLRVKLDVEAYATYSLEGEAVAFERSLAESGVLSQGRSGEIFEEKFEVRNAIGFNAFLGVEAGLPNDLTLGIRREVRHFPGSFIAHCSYLRNWQVYIRGKVLAFR